MTFGPGFCPSCGAARVPGASFCASCGQRLDTDASGTATTVLSPPTPGTADVPARPKRRLAITELVVIVAIIAAVLGGGYLLLRQNAAAILSNVASSVDDPAAGGALVSQQCKDQMAGLSNALFELDSRLSVGLSFSDYSGKVADAKVAYDKLNISSLDSTCLSSVGGPEENAMNEYIAAYNLWNNCISDSACKNDSITTELQDHWSKAATILAATKTKLP